jgi:DNA (cytosine-5)-methyltransferase 1
MVLHVDENDTQCPFVAGMEDISVDEVLRLRDCVLTNKPYPLMSFRVGPRCAFPASFGQREIKQQLFYGGRLACRVVVIRYVNKTSKTYSGVIRHLYAKEADIPTTPVTGAGQSRTDSIRLDVEEPVLVVSNGLLGRGVRSRSDFFESTPNRHTLRSPTKQGHFTFGDVFCGAGGASQGAKQAGLHVKWGLDNDSYAIQAYQNNHHGALPFRCNAHNFPPRGHTSGELRVDVLHLSPPCCYFSPAHTRDGPNDQANLEAIYTVGPILDKVRPRSATLEQTFGLSTRQQHKANFLMLLHDIGKAGYDVRYKIQDLSEFGLAQQRKRLLIIASRRGTPLPPFPRATHGPVGSGLKPWNYIRDALVPIERFASRLPDDRFHQPKPAKERREPYSPQSFLKSCITTSGASVYHYSGTRRYTPRELSFFQSFPYGYQFCGSQGEATKQIGNAFPPVMAEALYRTIAKTLEAFDNGYIGAEDDLSDLDGILERKGAITRAMRPIARASFNPPSRPAGPLSRYLVCNNTAASSGQTTASSSSPFARRNAPIPQGPRSQRRGGSSAMSLMGGILGDSDDNNDDDVRETIEVRPRRRRRTAVYIDNENEPTWISDSD